MKKSILGILFVWIVAMCHAQIVQENEAAVVYYMPKTELSITLHYDIVEQKPGVFYQYAERYLGAKDIILNVSKSYILTDVQMESNAIADTDRAYKVTAQKGFNSQLLTLSEDGRLLGYNAAIEENGDRALQKSADYSGTPLARDDEAKGAEKLMPLLEEQFMAGSMAKMAEGAAKQIYRLRETRLNLLAGDMEHVPADGMAMQLVLDELKEQEQALVELFVGTRTLKQGHYTFSYSPKESIENEIICRISQHTGIVDKNDLSGEPIYLTVQANKQSLQPITEANSKAPALSQLYYNLPGTANICITYKGQEMAENKIQVAQYGVAIPLALELFIGKTPVIHIHPETGNVLSIKH